MSDPVVNIEIEDVLASIRRLVSEGETPREVQPAATDQAAKPVAATTEISAPIAAPAASANSTQAPDKLVLSPDQMVSVPAASEPHAPSEPLLLTPAEHGPVPDESEHDAESAPSDETETEAAEAEMMFVAPEFRRHDAVQNDVHKEVTSEPSGPEARSQLLSTIAELEAAVTDTSDDFEPDGSEATPVVDWAQTTANGAIFGARASTTRVVDMLPSRDKELQEAQPEGVGEDPVAEIAATVVETETVAIVSDLDDTLTDFLEAEAALDEDALREMVVAIVREELQGALGERITRNVRKLVRREIHRVLASEEFS